MWPHTGSEGEHNSLTPQSSESQPRVKSNSRGIERGRLLLFHFRSCSPNFALFEAKGKSPGESEAGAWTRAVSPTPGKIEILGPAEAEQACRWSPLAGWMPAASQPGDMRLERPMLYPPSRGACMVRLTWNSVCSAVEVTVFWLSMAQT